MNGPVRLLWFLILALVILLTGCQSTAAGETAAQAGLEQQSLSFSGQGPQEILLDAWEGPALLHLTASQGDLPFRLVATSGLDFQILVDSESSVNMYSGINVEPAAKMQLRIEGDRAWQMEVLPVQTETFDILQVPGTYSGLDSRVFLVQGKHSVATFNTDQAEQFEAWALGENQKWERLTITAQGDYKGKSVLPEQTQMIIVSATGPWSVIILEPCCEKSW